MNKIRKFIIAVVVIAVFAVLSLFAFTYYSRAESPIILLTQLISPEGDSSATTRTIETRTLPNPTFLSEPDLLTDATLEINLPTLFSAPVIFEQDITAPNILYNLTAGDGIELSGDPQSPTITNTGVLTFEGLTGDIDLQSDNIRISTSGNTITLSAEIPEPDIQRLTESDIEAFIFDDDNTGILSSGTLALEALSYIGYVPPEIVTGDYYNISGVGTLTSGTLNLNTLSYIGTVPSSIVSGTYPLVTGVGTLESLTVAGPSTVRDMLFVGTTTPSADMGRVYFNDTDEKLYLYTSLGWIDLTAGGGITYTTDGEGIELFGNEFRLELDGDSLSKSASGLKISDTYPGQLSITTVGTITSGTWNGSEIEDQYISDALTISADGSVDDGALSSNVSLLGQSIETGEITDGTILPLDIDTGGTPAQNGYSLIYNSTTEKFDWISPASLGINYWARTSGILSPVNTDDVLQITSSTNTPLTLTNTGSGPSFRVNDADSDLTPFIIDGSGRVGIGTSNPTHQLDVAGRIGINSTQVVYLPSQSTFTGSLVLGNGGGSLTYTTGSEGRNNTFLGMDVGRFNSTGYHNTIVGQLAGYAITTGNNNTVMGRAAGASLSTAVNNTILGADASFQTTAGGGNTIIGGGANYNNQSGANNVIIGYQAGFGSSIHSKTGNIMIGYRAGYFDHNNNRLYIENSNSTTPLIYGNFDTDAVTINSYLGIGKTNPSYNLDVAGTGRLSGNLQVDGAFIDSVGISGATGNILTSTETGTSWLPLSTVFDNSYFKQGGNSFTSDAVLGTNDAYGLALETDGTTRMYIDTTGNVGIGGSNPATNPSLYVNSDGNVGIGTASPTAFLHVYSTSTSASDDWLRIGSTNEDAILRIYGSRGNLAFRSSQSATNTDVIDFGNGVGGTFSGGSNFFLINPNSVADDSWIFNVREGNTSRFAITGAGDVGIGTTAPEAGFDVGRTAWLRGSAGGSSGLYVDSSGQVGIGTTAPGSEFAIGNIQTGTGTPLVIDSSGNVWKDGSARKYKTNIESFTTDFAKILDLKPVSYDFKETGMHTIGYIAEDVDAAGLKDLVVYDTAGQPDGIKYDRMAVYLLEVVKEQQKSIRALKEAQVSLDTEGTVEMKLTQNNELPSSEFEKIDIIKEGNSEFIALQHKVEYELTSEISNVRNTVESLKNEMEQIQEKVDTIGSEKVETDPFYASISGELKRLEQEVTGMKADLLTASISANLDGVNSTLSDLTVTGKTNLYDVGIVGDIVAGLITVDGVEASINSLGEPLKLQSDKMSEVEIMGGLVRVTTEGDVHVGGQVAAQKFIVNTENEVTASAGEAIIPSGKDEIIINTESVNEGSLIYVTFTSDYTPATRYWVESRKKGESFVLKMDKVVDQDSQFSWWIVN